MKEGKIHRNKLIMLFFLFFIFADSFLLKIDENLIKKGEKCLKNDRLRQSSVKCFKDDYNFA